jgi:hypothetical protein
LPLLVSSTPKSVIKDSRYANAMHRECKIWKSTSNSMEFEMLWSRFSVGICSISNLMHGIANTGITIPLIKFKKQNKVITHRTLYSTLSSSTYQVESMSWIVGYIARQSHFGLLPYWRLRRLWAHHDALIDAGPPSLGLQVGSAPTPFSSWGLAHEGWYASRVH